MKIKLVAIDLAKLVFQVCIILSSGKVRSNQKYSREKFVELLKVPIRVRTGKQNIKVPLDQIEGWEGGATAVDLEVTVSGKGGKTPRMGFDLQL